MSDVDGKPTRWELEDAIDYIYQLREGKVGIRSGKNVGEKYFIGCMRKFEALAYGVGIATYLESRNLTIEEAKKLFSSSKGADDEAFRTAPDLECGLEVYKDDNGVVCEFTSVLSYAPKVLEGSASEGLSDQKNPHCALTSAAYLAALFELNDIKGPNGEDLLDGDYVASAAYMHGVSRKVVNGVYVNKVEPLNNNGGILGEKYRNYEHFNNRDKNLAQLILDGDVKSGDIISIPVPCNPGEGSGMHAMIVSNVEYYKDDKGQKQARYTVVDNNGGDVRARYRIIDTASSDQYDKECNNQYVVYTSVNKFVREYMRDKANNLSCSYMDSLEGAFDTDISSLMSSLQCLEEAMMLDTSYKNNCGGMDRFQKLEKQKEKIIERYMEKYQYKLKKYGEFGNDWEEDSWAKDKNDLYSQQDSSDRAFNSNMYLLKNGVYGNSGEGGRIDQALARREVNDASQGQSADMNITPSEFMKMNEKDSRS